jgi:DNA-binding winged helix-turn-helix (wHTH) protein/tetratricopeptide (TPR) repeat protein
LNAEFLAPTVIQFSGFRLDPSNQCLWRLEPSQAAARIDLPPKTFAVLRHLVEHPRRLMSTEALLEAVWPNVHVLPEVLKGHIGTIRRVLGDSVQQPRFIETQRGRGYRFIAPIDTPPSVVLSGYAARRADYFVDRTIERRAMQAAWQRAQAGGRQWLFVSGEAGIGKTTLVSEFLSEFRNDVAGAATPDDTHVLGGECVEGYGGTEPFYPLLQGLSCLCRSAAGTEITRTLIAMAPTWAVLLLAHVPADIRESLFAQTLGAGRERMLREICEWLEALASDRVMLLVLEDLHWSDASTIDVLSALTRRPGSARMMLIATFRRDNAVSTQHPVVNLSDALRLRGECEVLELAPLTRAAIGAWLTHGAAPNPLDEELAHFVAERCGGNPLFMQAMLDHLHEQGWVRKTADGWQQTASTSQLRDVLPHTIAQVIEARIRLLCPDEQRALEAASVAGMTFSPQTVAHAAAMPATAFEDLCDGLARDGQFVRRAGRDDLPEGTAQWFSFTHALVRSVFYERQGMIRRSKSHRLIGEGLERLYPEGKRGSIATELCRHFSDARQWDKALDYVRIALQTAKVRHAYREAIATLDQADTLLARLPADLRASRRLEFLEARAALYAAAHEPQAVAAYMDLNEQAAKLGRTDVQLRALPGLSYVLSWNDQARSLACLDDALRLSASFPDRRVSALTRVICNVRRIWTRGWSAHDARECAAALDLLRETADGVSIAKAQLDSCMLLMVSTRYRDALHSTQTNYQVLYAHAVRHPGFDISRGMWMVRLGVAWAHLSLGDFGRSLAEFDRGIQLYHDNGNYFAARTLQVYRGWLLIHTMDFETVLELDRQFREAADRPTSGSQQRERTAFLPPQQRVWTILAGLAYAGLDEREQAAACFAEAERQLAREPIMFDWYWRLMLDWGSADLALASGERAVAQRRAKDFLDRALATEERTWQALAWETMARVSLNAGDLENARLHIEAAFSASQGFETPLADWHLQRTAARLHEARGEASEAAFARQRCVELRVRLAGSVRADSGFGARLAQSATSATD